MTSDLPGLDGGVYHFNPADVSLRLLRGGDFRGNLAQATEMEPAVAQGFREFQAARRTIQGYEAIHMIRKGQVRWVAGDHLLRQIQFNDSLFELAA
jgi:hypothetical protein